MPFGDDESTEQYDGCAQPCDGGARVATERNEQCADSREEQRRTQPVDLHLPGETRSGIGERDHRHAAEPERHIQIEDPTPGQRIGDVAADERAGNRRDAPDTAEERLRPRALRQRVQLAYDRHAHRDDRARAKALNGPCPDQGEHARGGAGKDGPNEKNRDAEQVHAASSVQVGESSPDRYRRR
jgi:hypothetical protein